MLKIGVQTQNVIYDNDPDEGFERLVRAGFSCADFSLNSYLINKKIYKSENNGFFNKSVEELLEYFTPHKEAAARHGIKINQMHMPYPVYVPNGKNGINEFLWNEVAIKSMEICRFLECPNIVIHGFKLTRFYGSEEAEWAKTREFIDHIAPMAVEAHAVICMENLYNGQGSHMVEGPGCDAVKAVKRIDEINDRFGTEVAGFCLDTGHANLVGIDMESFIETLGSRLKVLHMHDNDGVADLHQLPYTFTRTRENDPILDWNGFIRGLRKIRFDGVLSFETAPVLKSFPDELKDDALRFIAAIGRYFAGQIEAS